MYTRFVAFLSDALENPGSSAPGPHCWGCYQKGHGGRASSVARTNLMSPRTSSCRVFWVLPLLYSPESPAIHREDSSGSHLWEKVCYSFISGRFSYRKNVCAAPQAAPSMGNEDPHSLTVKKIRTLGQITLWLPHQALHQDFFSLKSREKWENTERDWPMLAKRRRNGPMPREMLPRSSLN